MGLALVRGSTVLLSYHYLQLSIEDTSRKLGLTEFNNSRAFSCTGLHSQSNLILFVLIQTHLDFFHDINAVRKAIISAALRVNNVQCDGVLNDECVVDCLGWAQLR